MVYAPAGLYSALAIRACAGTFLALCTLVVVGRFWARYFQRASLRIDDWFIVPAWLLFIGIAACMLESTRLHTFGYTPAEAAPFHPDAYASGIIQNVLDISLILCLGFTKLSILYFYKRVFVVRDQTSKFKVAINTTIVVVILWMLAFTIVTLCVCGDHFEGFWNRPIFVKYCAKTGHAYLISNSATDFFLELVVIILPIPKIWNLQASAKRKAAITFVFMAALISIAASLVRLTIIGELIGSTATTAADAALANSATYNVWMLEAGSSILAVNLPSLWYLRTRKGPEKMLRSLRSMVSLASGRSATSSAIGGSKFTPKSGSINPGTYSKEEKSFDDHRIGDEESALHVHVTRQGFDGASAQGGVQVTHEVTQSFDRV